MKKSQQIMFLQENYDQQLNLILMIIMFFILHFKT